MRKRLQFRISVSSTVKDEVSWLQIFLLESLVRQKVKLIGLVPFSESIAKISSQIKNTLSNQGTTVDEKRSIIERISRWVKFLPVRHPDIFMCSLDEFLSQLIFELKRGSINLDVLEILVELELIELFLLELLEGILDGDFGCEVGEFLVFFVLLSLIFHIQL